MAVGLLKIPGSARRDSAVDAWFNVGFFHGEALPADDGALESVIVAAYLDIKARRKADST